MHGDIVVTLVYRLVSILNQIRFEKKGSILDQPDEVRGGARTEPGGIDGMERVEELRRVNERDIDRRRRQGLALAGVSGARRAFRKIINHVLVHSPALNPTFCS
jgi:hypothetical protein